MSVFDVLTLAIAAIALALSATTFWSTEFRRGRILLSKPTILFFGWDTKDNEDVPKIMLRAALFSTGARGHILESLYLVVNTADGKTIFPFWGYGSESSLVRGSGLFVGPEGYSAYHHFNPLPDDNTFSYASGQCSVEVWAEVVGLKADVMLGKFGLDLPNGSVSTPLLHHEGGVLWTWSPAEKIYVPEVSSRPDLRAATPVPGFTTK